MHRTKIPVGLMVPESVAGGSGRRGAPDSAALQARSPVRRRPGSRAIDNAPILVTPLDGRGSRAYTANVAGPAASLVAKLRKFGERKCTPGRLVDKDAHDPSTVLFVAARTPPNNATKRSTEAPTSKDYKTSPGGTRVTRLARTCSWQWFRPGEEGADCAESPPASSPLRAPSLPPLRASHRVANVGRRRRDDTAAVG
jgi:hypothetical protein